MEQAALLITLAVAMLAVVRVRTDKQVMKDVTLGFGEVLEQCREQSQLTEEMMEEFFHIWSDDFKFVHRELGCAIKCMARHYNLLTDTHRMHHKNADEFIKSFPNGEILAQRMVAMIHECEKQHDEKEDHCWRILRILECFKLASQEQGLAPTMEMMLAEFIMEAEAS